MLSYSMHHVPLVLSQDLSKSEAGRAAPPQMCSPDLYNRHEICHPDHFLTIGDHIRVLKTASLKIFLVGYVVSADTVLRAAKGNSLL